MSKGKTPALSRGERFENLEAKVKNLEASIRIMQMMQQQMGQTLMPIQQDVSGMASQLQTASYTNLAIQELLKVDPKALDDVYQKLRLNDYNEVSEKEDKENGFSTLETVESDQNIVILTSHTPDEEKDRGIFRTKMVVAELGPELTDILVGKKVGDVFDHELQGIKHVFELIAIRSVPLPVEEVSEPVLAEAEAPVVEG